MKLEAIDPLNLSAICVATVRKVRTLVCFWSFGGHIKHRICLIHNRNWALPAFTSRTLLGRRTFSLSFQSMDQGLSESVMVTTAGCYPFTIQMLRTQENLTRSVFEELVPTDWHYSVSVPLCVHIWLCSEDTLKHWCLRFSKTYKQVHFKITWLENTDLKSACNWFREVVVSDDWAIIIFYPVISVWDISQI